MKKILIIVFLSVISSQLFAKGEMSNVKFMPFAGYERVQKLKPTPEMTTHAVYGANIMIKLPILSVEFQFSRGTDYDTDSATSTKYETTLSKARLGLRGDILTTPLLSTYLRAGAELRVSEVKTTPLNSAATTETSRKGNPYLGAGLMIHILQNIDANIDLTGSYVPTSNSSLSALEISPSVGIIVKI